MAIITTHSHSTRSTLFFFQEKEREGKRGIGEEGITEGRGKKRKENKRKQHSQCMVGKGVGGICVMAFFRTNHKRKRTKGERREGEGGHTKREKMGSREGVW